MHYDNESFAKNGTYTISSKEKGIPFGGAPELSPWILNKLIYSTKSNVVSQLMLVTNYK